MKYFLHVLLLSVLALAVTNAHSHGSTEPVHGGVVKIIGEMSFELVNAEDRVELHLLDDGEEVDTEEMTCKIKVDHASGDFDIDLKPAGGSSFSASDVTIPRGSNVLVLVTLANGYSKIAGKFTID